MLKFEALSSVIDISFWNDFSRKKLDILRLSDADLEIFGVYFPSIINSLGSKLNLDISSFEKSKMKSSEYSNYACICKGLLMNSNTIQSFNSLDKNQLLNKAANEILQNILNKKAFEDPSLICRFIVTSFADLKNHKYLYWCAFPAIVPSQPITCSSTSLFSSLFSEIVCKDMQSKVATMQATEDSFQMPFFLVKIINNKVEALKLVSFSSLSEMERENTFFGFIDPCQIENIPGWILRNYLALINLQFGLHKLKVLSFRLGESSLVLNIEIPLNSYNFTENECKGTGWEYNNKGKLGPKIMDLSSMMDPSKLAETAVDLNLRLMRWRAIPDLNTSKIAETKCLLLGAGTLGCAVSRSLLAWGFRNIDFVDCGIVSYSNPVRQSLYTIRDCEKKALKAETAAFRLKEIYPGVESKGYNLFIQMPGHAAASPSEEKEVIESIKKLDDLIVQHDVIFLLTDSRESRWLPTVIAGSYNKPIINVALGFDTFMVMRHGVKDNDLGCYFCSDVVAPENSSRDRTLDQQCTVTRPGLAPIAGAMSVELLVALLHHPLLFNAPADNRMEMREKTASPLGLVPHQIRGFITYLENIIVKANAFDKCTACSAIIVEQYKKYGTDFVLKIMADPSELEKLSGLTKLKEDVDSIDIEWEDD